MLAAANDAQVNDAQASVTRRLGELLGQQRERLQGYLAVLEHQRAAIESGGEEAILAYVEILGALAAEILTIQRAIDPLETMRHATGVIAALRAELEDLKDRAAEQSRYNSDLLSARMAELRKEINILKTTQSAIGRQRSLYRETASLIDIEG
jgi:FtsZ-binding cell division protein ZapB